MGKFIDLTDKTFERLHVIRRAEDAVTGKRHRVKWLCKCECGNVVTVLGDNLREGKTLSCGCLQKERASQAVTKHGDTDDRLYNVWQAMKSRCTNPNVPNYHNYGGRGISVCDQWMHSYDAFKQWAYDNGYQPGLPRGKCTIDRIDNNGNYEPDNCRWVTQTTQMSNVRTNRHVEYDGKDWTIAQLARHLNIPYNRLSQRIVTYGYTVEQAIQKDLA